MSSLTKQLFKGSTLLSFNAGLGQAMRFVRNVIVARILSPEDFGVAATLWLATSFLDMTTDLGVVRMIVQSKEGDRRRFGATAHSVLLMRGILTGLILFAAAGPLSTMFDTPESRPAFMYVALIPLLRGLNHSDVVRLQREMRFAPYVKCHIWPSAAVTLAAWPMAMWFKSYWAIVYMELGREALQLFISHAVSERRYWLMLDRRILAGMLGFGWPLLINGLLMYGTFQGDRLVISMFYDMERLGVYSVAFALAMAPAMQAGSICSQLLLPVLSEAQEDRPRFERLYKLSMLALCGVAVLLGVLFVLLGPRLILIIYGQKYAMAGIVIGCLGAMQSVRLLRVGVTLAALALGDTRNSLVANVFRTLGMGLALIAAVYQAPLYWIAAGALGGEILALAIATAWMHRRHGLSAGTCAWPAALLAGALGSAASAMQLGYVQSNWIVETALFLALMSATPIVMASMFKEFREVFQDSWGSLLHKVHTRWAT